jgi:hypothetical protein
MRPTQGMKATSFSPQEFANHLLFYDRRGRGFWTISGGRLLCDKPTQSSIMFKDRNGVCFQARRAVSPKSRAQMVMWAE